MALTKEQILQADDLKREKVSVPEWGGEVWVRVLRAAERDSFEASCLGDDNKPNLANLRARLAVLTVVDGEGKRLFSEADVAALGAKSAAALDRIFTVAQQLNGMTEADVEGLAKNSAGAP